MMHTLSETLTSFSSSGIAAATMFMPNTETELSSTQLRVAFDGDAVLFSDESEIIVKEHGLDTFFEHEKKFENKPLAQVTDCQIWLTPHQRNNFILYSERSGLIFWCCVHGEALVSKQSSRWPLDFLGTRSRGEDHNLCLWEFWVQDFFHISKQSCQRDGQKWVNVLQQEFHVISTAMIIVFHILCFQTSWGNLFFNLSGTLKMFSGGSGEAPEKILRQERAFELSHPNLSGHGPQRCQFRCSCTEDASQLGPGDWWGSLPCWGS